MADGSRVARLGAFGSPSGHSGNETTMWRGAAPGSTGCRSEAGAVMAVGTDAAPRGPLAPRRPGSDARRRDRDEQEGDEQEPAGTGRRGRRGERAGRRRAGRLEDGVAWDCGSRVGAMPRDRSSGAATLGRGAEPRVLGEVEERGRVNAGSPLDLGSQGGRECRATRGRCRLADRHKSRRGGYDLDVLGDRSIRRNRRRRSGRRSRVMPLRPRHPPSRSQR